MPIPKISRTRRSARTDTDSFVSTNDWPSDVRVLAAFLTRGTVPRLADHGAERRQRWTASCGLAAGAHRRGRGAPRSPGDRRRERRNPLHRSRQGKSFSAAGVLAGIIHSKRWTQPPGTSWAQRLEGLRDCRWRGNENNQAVTLVVSIAALTLVPALHSCGDLRREQLPHSQRPSVCRSKADAVRQRLRDR